MTKDELERKRTEAYKALECIFISVEPSIAHDLNLKVRIYINAIVEELVALKTELQAWRDGALTEEILRNGDGYIKVGCGCLIISAHYLDEKDAEIAALRAKAAELDVVMVGSTLCPLEDVEDFLVRASNRLDDGRVGGDRLAPLDLAIGNALRLVQACLRE